MAEVLLRFQIRGFIMKKKVTAVILSMLILAAFTACGNSGRIPKIILLAKRQPITQMTPMTAKRKFPILPLKIRTTREERMPIFRK